ncbi:GDP-L-fucose synthase [Pseudomonas sp. SK3(2021)]|uniref:GDP-L-fucose synthase n=1 Tax=Pseudomonas sp. SK3(2021) TaxID=2841064 RepID=UPI00192C1752|nr:GDP-L-fucose synthase [Pseudomonas sp. SK3(2021)]QQZ40469.1 GDP-L-fucose synthase [Pseudomonas sp. SK3(2021)]
MPYNSKIYVAGHRGMVGSAILRELKRRGYKNIVVRDRAELDLCDQVSVRDFFAIERPDQVYLAAAKVGGIYANNTYPADFLYQNIMIQANVIHEAWSSGVQKLLFLGSSCIYPRLAQQPMTEDALLTSKLEETNEAYAIAKIAGIKLCESYNRQYGVDYRSVMPTNLYGPGDNYHSENSHVIPALIRKFHEAKVAGSPAVVIWGSGTPKREFLFVDDMAEASVHVMEATSDLYASVTKPTLSHINVGCGTDMTILELAHLVAKVIGFDGLIELDSSKPDGTPRKLMDISRIKRLGWQPSIGLDQGLSIAYADFLKREKVKVD